MAGEEDEDYVVYGTPLEREEDLGPRKRKAALELGQARRVALWNQEVTDAEGRRRFHGAFSGGFSAGYYNTVGSKEGWAPQSFMSSRKARTDRKEQSVYDFLDEDEKASVEEDLKDACMLLYSDQDLDSKELRANTEFDTFGSTAAELARRQAAQEMGKRPSALPGPAPDEIVVPVAESIGVKLLLKMGWRHGRLIGPRHIAATSDAQREARKAMMALAQNAPAEPVVKVYGAQLPPGLRQEYAEKEPALAKEEELLLEEAQSDIDVPRSTPVFVMNPKNDLYGLGFDPFRNAPEFRERKHAYMVEGRGDANQRTWRGRSQALFKSSLFRPNVGRMASGFGIGALEDHGEEDEDVYAEGMDFEIREIEEEDNAAADLKKPQRTVAASSSNSRLLPGFKFAGEPSIKPYWFPPPVVPRAFVPGHRFIVPLHSERLSSKPAPPEAQPPPDTQACKIIEGLASFVAKSGQRFEDMSREKHIGNPAFGFLFGGAGHDYYVRRLWEEEQKLVAEGKQQFQVSVNRSDESRESSRLDSDQRGKILGETPLARGNASVASMVGAEDRARLQSALSSTFTTSASATAEVNAALHQPFQQNPAKQARFEQFLKDKSSGGLRKQLGGGSGLTEMQRAQEIFEFEGVARALQEAPTSSKVLASGVLGNLLPELAAIMGNRFTTGGIESTSLVCQKDHICMAPNIVQRLTRAGGIGQPQEKSDLSKQIIEAEEAKQYPHREENPWRPTSMLCKRFNLLDPYAGKPPPIPKPRSRTESFILIANPKESRPEFPVPADQDVAVHGTSSVSKEKVIESLEPAKDDGEVQIIPEKPVDLYKAIFSDESEDEDNGKEDGLQALPQTSMRLESITDRERDPAEKSVQAANSALNRLVAGDFLESLGKELGLKVPSALPEGRHAADNRPAARPLEDTKMRSSTKEIGAVNRGGEPMQLDSGRFFQPGVKAGNMNIMIQSPTSLREADASRKHEGQSQQLLSSFDNVKVIGGPAGQAQNEVLRDDGGRWGAGESEEKRGKERATTNNGTTNITAASGKRRSSHDSSRFEYGSDRNKAKSRPERQEEKRLKKEDKEKQRHKRRKEESRDEPKKRKKVKNQDKERRHHHKHKHRRAPSSASSSTSSASA